MKKFKGLWSGNQFFTYKNLNYFCKEGIFETDDAELITFLLENPNFKLIEEEVSKKK